MVERQKSEAFYLALRDKLENAGPDGVYFHFFESDDGTGTILETTNNQNLFENPDTKPSVQFFPYEQLQLGLQNLPEEK